MRGITKNVVGISLVSFFNDIASEMIYPVVPIFLTTVLGAPVTILGLIKVRRINGQNPPCLFRLVF